MTPFSVDEALTRDFSIAQVSESRSSKGVARGIHFATTPPGSAKLVWCASGRAVDFLVDLRQGSPTMGVVDTVELVPGRVVVVPTGVGHAYQATEDDTVIVYLISSPYVAANEQSVSIVDPDIGIELPLPHAPQLSARDTEADTLATWLERGGLPRYEDCVELDRTWGLPHATGA